MRNLGNRIAKLEKALEVVHCECHARPAVGITFPSERAWQMAQANGVDRQAEEAKQDWTCKVHGRLGPGITVMLNTYSIVPEGEYHSEAVEA